MKKIVIDGPAKLKGGVKIQGAKNSAMKHVVIPLITNGVYKFNAIPKISSIEYLLQIISSQNIRYSWSGQNMLTINSTRVTSASRITKDLFYQTSGGVYPIPILASRFGECELETDPERNDYGGDQIGSRTLEMIRETLRNLGIESKYKANILKFYLKNSYAVDFKVDNKSFMASVLAIFAMLFKTGVSNIFNPTSEAEFDDIIDLLIIAGAKITKSDNKISVEGPVRLNNTFYENMPDRHDFITLLSAALSTNSDIGIIGVDWEKMKLDCLEPVLDSMNIKLQFDKDICKIPAQLDKIKPTTIYAGRYPQFITEWQVLMSPLFTQVGGTSKIVETVFSNRMTHWMQLEKMGIKYEIYQDPKYPEENGQPRAVKVKGPQNLYGASVTAKDVRSGAALVIAGLVAKGRTEINGAEHIERGYDNFVGRLQSLGAKIKIKN